MSVSAFFHSQIQRISSTNGNPIFMKLHLYNINHIRIYLESKAYWRKLEIQMDFPLMFTFVSRL